MRSDLTAIRWKSKTFVVFALVCATTAMQRGIAQEVPAEIAGPYSAAILADGPGLSYAARPATWESKAAKSPIPDALTEAGARWTLAFWFKSDDASSSSGATLIAGIGDPATQSARYVALLDGRLGVWLGQGQQQQITAQSQLAHGWHFVVASADDRNVTLFADGREVASGTYSEEKIAPRLMLAPAGGDHHFGGSIACLRVYSEALNAAQVAQLAANAPDFNLPQYAQASPHWPVQTRGMAGQTEPQDPSTLPRARAALQHAVARPITEQERTTRLVGNNPWTVRGGWKLAAAIDVKADGAEISKSDFNYDDKKWYTATVPGTVLTTLIDRGVYPDPDYGLNNLAIPETLAHQDYWYRVEFPAPAADTGRRLTLTFNGINYAAEVWLNGKRLGDIKGAFIRGNFDVTKDLTGGAANVLAVHICPPPHPGLAQEESLKAGPGENGGMQVLDGPTFSATEGWDWIPSIRDRNTGIWQDVTLTASGPVEVGDLNVITTLPKSDNSEADVEIEAPLMNVADAPMQGTLTAEFDGVKISKQMTLKAGENVARLTPSEFAQLKVQQPKLWWPNGYGEPALHHLKVRFDPSGGQGSSEQQIDFGMREVSYELSLFDGTGNLRRVEVLPARTHDEATPLIDESHKGIRQIADRTPNLDQPKGPDGKPLSPQMLEWVRRTWVHTLAAGAEQTASIRPVEGGWPATDLVIKVNGVRIAARGGNWGMDDSRKRVSTENLEPYFRLHRDAHVNIIRDWMGQNTEESFYALADKYGLMVWNDFWESTQNYNLEAQDAQLFLANARDSILHFRHHPSIVVWCGRNEGVPQPIINEGLARLVRTLDHTRYYTGSSNVVNLRNSGPYQLQSLDTYYKINRGFSVELGIPSVPTLESIKAFIPEPDRWPISDTWAYHDWHVQGNGAVKPFMDYMERAFGAPTGLEDFERKAQMIDYAAHRAIFEGFAAHLWQPNSARLIWMTQPAWPSMEWNFLGHDYDTQSSFYGTQKACEPVHAQLNLEDGSVDLINLHGAKAYKVRTLVAGLDGKPLLDETNDLQAAANARTAVRKLDLAKLAGAHAVLVKLQVSDESGRAVSDNFYWWSQEDGGLKELNELPQANLQVSAEQSGDAANGESRITVKLHNGGSAPALLLKLTLTNSSTGERILPAYYSENYVSLLPGEDRSISVEFSAGKTGPAITLRGWNLAQREVPVR